MGSRSLDLPEVNVTDVPISALEHFVYCPRQCALIHVEQTFDENLYTIRGSRAHDRVTSGETSWESGVRVARSLPLYSDRYGIHGKADVVELRESGPVPVEYKLGRPRRQAAEVQLCAQALCLEEMFEVDVPIGCLYSVGSRRRSEVRLDARLRAQTVDAIDKVRCQLDRMELPAAPNDDRCPRCSLIDTCLPGVVAESRRLIGLQGSLFQPVAVGHTDA